MQALLAHPLSRRRLRSYYDEPNSDIHILDRGKRKKRALKPRPMPPYDGLTIETGISVICRRLQPEFDASRLCVKVVSTWEGLQACRQLTDLGIQTLATTLFTMEQAVLAAEAGCMYVAPFVHELKAFFDSG